MTMEPENHAAARQLVAMKYDLALQKLGIDAEPLAPDATEAESDLGLIRRVSAMWTMALIEQSRE